MDILSISPPRLDAQDVPGSFQKISDYLQNMTELIDFTLGQYSGQLAIVDASGVQSILNEFRADLVSMQRDISDIDKKASSLSGSISTIQSDVNANKESISALTERVENLEGRVTKLEGGA